MNVDERPGLLVDAIAVLASKVARGRRLDEEGSRDLAPTHERPFAPLPRPRNGYCPECVASSGVSASSVAGNAAAAGPTIRVLRRPKKRSFAYSFVGGSLLGVAACLPIFALDLEEGAGPLALLGSLTLACTGVAMHVRSLK
jgi:hypothetical protein